MAAAVATLFTSQQNTVHNDRDRHRHHHHRQRAMGSSSRHRRGNSGGAGGGWNFLMGALPQSFSAPLLPNLVNNAQQEKPTSHHHRSVGRFRRGPTPLPPPPLHPSPSTFASRRLLRPNPPSRVESLGESMRSLPSLNSEPFTVRSEEPRQRQQQQRQRRSRSIGFGFFRSIPEEERANEVWGEGGGPRERRAALMRGWAAQSNNGHRGNNSMGKEEGGGRTTEETATTASGYSSELIERDLGIIEASAMVELKSLSLVEGSSGTATSDVDRVVDDAVVAGILEGQLTDEKAAAKCRLDGSYAEMERCKGTARRRAAQVRGLEEELERLTRERQRRREEDRRRKRRERKRRRQLEQQRSKQERAEEEARRSGTPKMRRRASLTDLLMPQTNQHHQQQHRQRQRRRGSLSHHFQAPTSGPAQQQDTKIQRSSPPPPPPLTRRNSLLSLFGIGPCNSGGEEEEEEESEPTPEQQREGPPQISTAHTLRERIRAAELTKFEAVSDLKLRVRRRTEDVRTMEGTVAGQLRLLRRTARDIDAVKLRGEEERRRANKARRALCVRLVRLMERVEEKEVVLRKAQIMHTTVAFRDEEDDENDCRRWGLR